MKIIILISILLTFLMFFNINVIECDIEILDVSIDTLKIKYPILSNESKCLFEFTVMVTDTDSLSPKVPLNKINSVIPNYRYQDIQMFSNDSISNAFYKVSFEVDIGSFSAEIEGYSQNDPLILNTTTIYFECEAIDSNSLSINIIGKMDIGDDEYYHSTIEIDGLKYPIEMVTSISGKVLNHISSNYYLFGFKKSEFVHSLPNQWDVDIILPNNEKLTVSGVPYYPSLQTTQNDIELTTYPVDTSMYFYETGANYSALYSFSLNATYIESLGFNYPMFSMSSGLNFFSPRVYRSSGDQIYFIGAFKTQITEYQTGFEFFYQKTGGQINSTQYDITATYNFPEFLFTYVNPQVSYDYSNPDIEKLSFTVTFPGCNNYDYNEIQVKYGSLEKLIKFPLGFISGSNDNFNMEFTVGINAGGTDVESTTFMVYPNGLQFNSASLLIAGVEGVQYYPAIIKYIEFFQMESFMYIIDMNVYSWRSIDMIYIYSSDGTFQEFNAQGSLLGSDGREEYFELVYNVLKGSSIDFIRFKNCVGGTTDFKNGDHFSFGYPTETLSLPNSKLNTTEFDLYSIYNISYSSNDIDVTGKSVGIRMTFTFSTFNSSCLLLKCVPPMGLQLLGPSFISSNLNYSYYPIKYKETIQLFYVDFKLKANSEPGIVPWKILINSNGIDIKNTNVGDNNQLRVVKSSTIDVYGPIFSEIIKTSDYNISKSVCWTITIVDEVNGFDHGEITIVGGLDNSIYKFEISPKSDYLTSGDKFNGVYSINVSLVSEHGYCATQIYSIFSVELYDTQGNPSKFSKYSSGLIERSHVDATLNPFINFLNDTSIIEIEYLCEFDVIDQTGPFLTFFNISTDYFNTGLAPSSENAITFTFSAQDSESGLKNNNQFQQPIVYLTSNNLEILECHSKIVAFGVDGEVDYECTIDYIPRGFGQNVGGILVSVYGFINNQGLYSGYSSKSLLIMEYPYSIFTGMSTGKSVITGASEITTCGGTLWYYGSYLGRDGYMSVLYEDEDYRIDHHFNATKGFSNVASISGIKETLKPFTITFYQTIYPPQQNQNKNSNLLGDGIGYSPSNTFKVTPVDYGLSSLVEPSSSEISQSSVETSSSSSSSSAASSSKTLPASSEVQIKCPGEPECGGSNKGVCLTTGICQCIEPWTGIKCDSRVVVISRSNFNLTFPTVEIVIPDGDVDENGKIIESTVNQNIKIKSIISLISIRELDFKNTVIKTFIFDHWTFKLVNDQVAQYFTNISNTVETLKSVNHNNGGANFKSLHTEETIYTNINVTMEWFNKTTVVEFAERNLTMNPSSVKYSIDISKYPFKSQLNHLQLVMTTSLESNEDDVCSTKEFGDSNAGDNANYGKLQINDHSVNGRYIKRATLDSKTLPIENQELKQDDTVPGDVKTGNQDVIDTERKSNYQYNYIGINIPHFDESVKLDPDFSVLLSSSPDSDDENSICSSSSSKGLTSAQLAGIIIGSIGFAAVVVVSVAYHFYKKKQQKSFVSGFQNKLKAMN